MLNYFRANQTKKQILPPKQLKSLSIISPTSDIMGSTTNSDVSGSVVDRNGNQQELASSSNRGDKDTKKPKEGGRPKGSMIECKTVLGKRQVQTLNHAAVEFKKLKDAAQSAGVRVKNNAYANILKETMMQFNLPEELPQKTVESKLKPGRKIFVAHPWPVSAMVTIEAHVLDAILQLAMMRQPITPNVALEFMYDLVKGTVVESDIYQWKKNI
jgi:hypothetical protein